MKKIVVRMRGGLGNQLFILFFTYHIINKLNLDDYQIVLDTREYKKYKIRDFELLKIINDSKIRLYDEKLDKDIKYDISRNIYHIIQKFIPKNKPMIKQLSKNGFLYSNLSSECFLPKNFEKLYIYGYFQDEKIVNELKNDILLKFNKKVNDKYLKEDCNNIAISIRWGKDYIKKKYPICSKAYYSDAIKELINTKYKDKKINILIFSDEIEQVKKANLYDEVTFVEDKDPVEQLQLLMKCDDFIISNSSFSWIGAYLGAKSDSVIIAPNYWYNKKETTDKTLLYFPKLNTREI